MSYAVWSTRCRLPFLQPYGKYTGMSRHMIVGTAECSSPDTPRQDSRGRWTLRVSGGAKRRLCRPALFLSLSRSHSLGPLPLLTVHDGRCRTRGTLKREPCSHATMQGVLYKEPTTTVRGWPGFPCVVGRAQRVGEYTGLGNQSARGCAPPATFML